MENIEILKEKVRKDPNSKLFLPLAEAYKEHGLIDEAIKVLLEGLERQPEYHSARVALGKNYLKKNMIAEAQIEFEEVVKAVPDNLFAHKKLMEIYYNNGDFDKLEKVCEIILTLNEHDEEASTMLYAIRETKGEQEAEQEEQKEDKGEEQKQEEKGEGKEEHPKEKGHMEKKEEGISRVEKGEESEEAAETDKKSVSAPVEEEVESIEAEDTVSEEEHVDKTKAHPEKHVILPTETMADICITQGLYHEAMRIYESILSKEPNNKKFLQRRDELKTLLDLMESKKKERTVKKLSHIANKLKEKS